VTTFTPAQSYKPASQGAVAAVYWTVMGPAGAVGVVGLQAGRVRLARIIMGMMRFIYFHSRKMADSSFVRSDRLSLKMNSRSE
jgi:hypothetical protein